MKKLLLFLLIFAPFSAFAGTDTDRICSDYTKWGKLQNESASVLVNAITGEKDPVYGIWKIPGDPYDTTTFDRLYYELPVRNGNMYVRSDIYMYNCDSKKPFLLMSLPLKTYESNDIAYVSASHIVLTQTVTDAELPGPHKMIVLDAKTKKKIITISNLNAYLNHTGTIESFAEGVQGWYLMFNDRYLQKVTAYIIDKHTKKIKEL